MSSVVDQRVVELRFDNANFERGVKTSMSTLDRLKSALKLGGASKGFEKVASAAKSVSFDAMGKGLDTVKAKFSALDAVAFSTLQRITNSGIAAAKSLMDNFSALGAARAGFAEYETQINSIQTILSNTSDKGTTMAQVRSALDELNTYADLTIYNFTEMTRNIGTFTAAGVDLATSTKSIQGIANLAAMSGSSSLQASTAMYQLSQAIAAGTVHLMDWNSVVNAGMGGTKFQEALKETAREYGVAVDALIEKRGSFRESLQEDWISAEILTTTLSKFTTKGAREYADAMLASGRYTQEQADALLASAQAAEDAATKVKTFTQLIDTLQEAMGSGWTKTWELFLGDFDEAKAFFTSLSDLLSAQIGKDADRRNNLLEGALSSNGASHSWYEIKDRIEGAGISYDAFVEKAKEAARANGVAIDEMVERAGSFEATLKEGWLTGDIFSQVTESMNAGAVDLEGTLETYQRLVDEVWSGEWGNGEERVRALTEAGYDYATVQALVNATVDGHRLAIDELSDVQLQQIGLTEEQIAVLRDLDGEWGSISADVGKKTGRELLMEGLYNICESCIEIFGVLRAAWEQVFPPMTSDDLYRAIEGFHDLTERLKPTPESLSKVAHGFQGIFSVLKIVKTIAGAAWDGIKPLIGGLFGALKGDGPGLLDRFASLGDAITAFAGTVEENKDRITEAVGGAAEFVGDVLAGIRDFVSGFLGGFGIDASSISLGGVVGGLRDFAESAKDALGDLRVLDGLGEMLSGLRTKLSDFSPSGLGAGFASWLQGVADTARSFADSIELPSLDGLTDWAGRLKGFLPSFGDSLDEGGNALESFADKVGKFKIGEVLSKIGEGFSNLFSGIGEAVSGFDPASAVGGAAEGVGAALSAVWQAVKTVAGDILGGVAGFVGDALGGVSRALSQADLSGIGDFLGGVGSLLLGGGIGKFFKSLAGGKSPLSLVGKITEILDSIKDVFEQLKDTLKSFTADLKATTLLKMAAAIGVLALSVKLLSTIDPEALLGATLACTALMMALSSAADRLPKSVGGSALSLVGTAVALLIVCSAVKKLAALQPEALLNAVAACSALMLALASSVNIAGDAKGGVATALKFVGLALAMKMLAAVVSQLGQMSLATLVQGGLAVAALEVAMGAAMRLAGKGGGLSGGLGFIGMAASLMMLVDVVREFASMERGAIEQGVGAVVAVVAAIGTAMAAMGAVKGNMLAVGLGFGAVATSLLLLAGVVKIFSGMSFEAIGTGLLGVVGTMLAMSVGMAAVGLAARLLQGSLPALLGFAVAIGIVGAAVLAVGTGFALFVSGLAALGGALTVYGGVISLGVTAIGTAISELLPIMAENFGNAIGAFCSTVPENAPAIGEALKALVGVALNVLVEEIPNLATALFDIIAAVLTECSTRGPELVGLLFDMFTGMLDAATQRLPDLTASMTAFLQALFDLFAQCFALVDLAAVRDGFDVIMGVNGVLGAIIVGGVLAIPAIVGAVLMGVAVTAIAGVLAALGALRQIEGFDWIVGEGAAVLERIGDAIGGFAGGLVGGALEGFSDHMPDIATNLSNFMANLGPFIEVAKSVDESVAAGAGQLALAVLAITAADFVAAVEDFITGGSSFSELGAELSAFAVAVSPFVMLSKTWGEGSFSSLDSLASGVMALSGANIVAWITDFLAGDGSLADFGTELSSFATSVQPFVDASKDWDADSFTGLGVLSSAVNALSKANFTSAVTDVLGIFTGKDASLESFGDDIAAFGGGLKKFVDEVGDIQVTDGVKAAPEIGASLAALAEAVPKQDGWLQGLMGNQDIGKFGEQAAGFGQGLKDYAAEVEGLENTGGVAAAPLVGESLAALAATIPKQDGWLQRIIGTQNLGDFGQNAAYFGAGVKQFADNVSGIDADSSAKAVTVGENLSSLMDSLDPSGSIFSGLTGEKNLKTFGENIAAFGASMKTFSDNIADIDADSMNGVVAATKSLADSLATLKSAGIDESTSAALETACTKISSGYQKLKADADLWDMETVDKVVTNVNNLRDMISGLSGIDSSGASSFQDAMESLNEVSISSLNEQFGTADLSSSLSGMFGSVGTVVSENTGAFSSAGKDLASALADGFQGQYSAVRSQVETVVDAVLTAISGKAGNFEDKGTSSMKSFANGIGAAGGAVLSAINSIASGCMAALSGLYSDFHTSGYYAAKGFADGISSSSYLATARATAMATAAKTAANVALGVRSPSRVFHAIGKFVVQGFTNALAEGTSRVSAASSTMATAAKGGFSDAIAGLFDSMPDSDFSNPTVRPVLDLSDVERGASAVGSLFGTVDVAYSASQARAASKADFARIQNGFDSGLSDSIERLNRKLDGVGGPSYTINGMSFEQGTGVAEAFDALRRSLVMEGRV